MWLALLADAGTDGLRIHDLRHSFASYALSGGQTLGVVGQLLGTGARRPPPGTRI